MSWPSWQPATPAHLPGVVTTPLQSSLISGAGNPASTLLSQATANPTAAALQYSPEQWAQMQQQNWQQWAQWQQQYQQWHQQYGAEYQKSMSALASTINTSVPPPLPTETKPPAPPMPAENTIRARPVLSYSTAPPPLAQQYSSAPPPLNQTYNQSGYVNNKRPLPQSAEFEANKKQMLENWNQPTPQQTLTTTTGQTKPLKVLNLEELTEAEKKFDKEFAAWEAQFNKWKEQNANHPDKTQYLEYEKKWEAWRASLLDRREQMRKKRVSLQASLTSSSKPSSMHQKTSTGDSMPDLFNKPPPNQNNEPLAFKQQQQSFLAEKEASQTLASFLKSSSNSERIPGLDLVKEGVTAIFPPEQFPVEQIQANTNTKQNQGPDLDAISKNINSILGDAKLLNILSMVTQNKLPPAQAPQNVPTSTVPSLMSVQVQPPSSGVNEDYSKPFSIMQPERVNNFDDQTRTSFTNGPNEQDFSYNDSQRGYSQFSGNNSESGFEIESHHMQRQHQQQFQQQQHQQQFQQQLQQQHHHQNRQQQPHDRWTEEEEYEKYHHMFSESNHSQEDAGNVANSEVEEEPLFVPQVVVDYEHKASKPVEPEVSLTMIRMFDYRHKPVNRIPYPDRPVWLSGSFRNIKQFDPLGTGRFQSAGIRDVTRYPVDRNESFERRNFIDRKDRRPNNGNRYEPNPVRGRNYHPGPGRSERKAVKRPVGLELEDLSDDEWTDEKVPVQEKFPAGRAMEMAPKPATSSITPLEDLINPPGRYKRPPRIAIILRGPPGSGKSYLAKQIKDKEVECGGSAPRILSLDDYFMQEHEKEVVEDGKVIKVKEMTYEYEVEMEESYQQSLTKAFKKTITDGFFQFVVVDNVNQKVKNFGEMWSFAKQNGFQVYICQMDLDPQLCARRNIHHRTESYIEDCISGWEPTPTHHPLVDPTGFLQSQSAITEVEMEEVNDQQEELDQTTGEGQLRSKWDTFDCSLMTLARLDGVNKPLRPSKTMEEYLQLDDEWEEPAKPTKPGQKRVRWADLEEQKQQKKMKALGFVVGHTDWNRIMDPTEGQSALTQTKYVDRFN